MNLDKIPHDRAGFGSKLTVRENGKQVVYELVMPEDSDPDRGFVSVASPIGRALVGKEEGRRGHRAHARGHAQVRDRQARHDPRRSLTVPDPSYSPRLRTGLLLCGAGTAGAYQAGVLNALAEAGVKIDVVAAHGAGVLTALCAAIDGTARPGMAAGRGRVRRSGAPIAGDWRCGWPRAGLSLSFCCSCCRRCCSSSGQASSTRPACSRRSRISTDTAAWLVDTYGLRSRSCSIRRSCRPSCPRGIVLGLLIVAGRAPRGRDAGCRGGAQPAARAWRVLVAAGRRAARRATSRARRSSRRLWRLVRGASGEPRPAAAEIGRRYVDVLTDNFGQPGFREC